MTEGRIHAAAEIGFGRGAAAYQRARPGYPAAAIDLLGDELGIGPGCRVVDLAAGTGKSTELLVGTGASVVAVEPVAEMRAQLAAALPDVEVLDGAAEDLPLPDASVDAVTVFQAFHWFDPVPALSEIARVLRPGGGLAIVWNVRDRRSRWVRDMAELIEARVGPLPYERHHYGDEHRHWAQIVAATDLFESLLASEELPHHQIVDVDLVVDRAASTSYVAALDARERDELLDSVRALLLSHPDLAGRGRFEFPHVTRVYWTSRRA